jgi:hypothetical protein
MFIYKFNQHTKKYYKYDTDDVDIFTPMFDESLHDNSITPVPLPHHACVYCNTMFPSRNKLFHHLGYMNIDIRPPHLQGTDHMMSGYDSDMGDYGFELKKKRSRKRRANYKAHSFSVARKRLKKSRQNEVKHLSSMLENGLKLAR